MFGIVDILPLIFKMRGGLKEKRLTKKGLKFK